MGYISLAFFGIGIFALCVNYTYNILWMIAGEKISSKIRDKYFRSLIKQEVGFYDKHTSGQFDISSDIALIKGGISEKLGLLISTFAQLISGLVVAFYHCWQLTLVMLGSSLIAASLMAIQQRLIARKTIKGQKYLGKVNQVVSESLLGIRTIYSFVGEIMISKKHSQFLSDTIENNKAKAHIQSIFLGLIVFFGFSNYAVGLYYGGRLILDGIVKPGEVMTVFFSIIIGVQGLGQLAVVVPDISKAQGSASRIFDLLDRTPEIDASEEFGVRLPSFNGKMSFQDIRFSYPTRPETPILKKIQSKYIPWPNRCSCWSIWFRKIDHCSINRKIL